MKRLFIGNIEGNYRNNKIGVLGWVKSIRKHSKRIFLDVTDSSGTIQAVGSKDKIPSDIISKIRSGMSVKLSGELGSSPKNTLEIKVDNIEIIGDVTSHVTPEPRKDFNIFDSRFADHVLNNRHLYLRNPRLMAVLKFKSNFIFEIHKWFNEQGFTFIDAPVLTELLLYDDSSAFKLNYPNKGNSMQEVFLSQCCTFQLEAAVHAFEMVYNITPSFRVEPSTTRHHLSEYWHLKAEIAWANLNDLIKFSERMLYNIARNTIRRSKKELETLGVEIDLNKMRPPYKKISYDEALEAINSSGKKLDWGRSIGMDEQKILTQAFGEELLFVEGIPCAAEGFPFRRDPTNDKITLSCDLISPHGFGEILGVAEKITDKKELLERMTEKGKTSPDQLARYQWYVDLREHGCIPHGGVGMGIERAIRYLLKLNHVRDAISFPRLFGRYPNP